MDLAAVGVAPTCRAAHPSPRITRAAFVTPEHRVPFARTYAHTYSHCTSTHHSNHMQSARSIPADILVYVAQLVRYNVEQLLEAPPRKQSIIVAVAVSAAFSTHLRSHHHHEALLPLLSPSIITRSSTNQVYITDVGTHVCFPPFTLTIKHRPCLSPSIITKSSLDHEPNSRPHQQPAPRHYPPTNTHSFINQWGCFTLSFRHKPTEADLREPKKRSTPPDASTCAGDLAS